MPQITTANGTIFYDDHRDPTVHRPPVLMVHGAGGSRVDWAAELARLPEANAIVPDLPGHGKSPPPGRQSVSAYAADMIALLDALKVPAAIIAGQSMGGAIAQTLALHSPDRVKGLILIGTGAKLGVHPDILNNIRSDPQRVGRLINEWEWAASSSDQLKRLGFKHFMECVPHVTYGDYLACSQFDVRPQLERIKTPTLIFGGTDDRMTPYKFSTFLQEHIPGSKLVTVQGGGHKMLMEQPQVVADAVREWLAESS
jgi:pimeloyl-ACP methyl ester carboxylesterase